MVINRALDHTVACATCSECATIASPLLACLWTRHEETGIEVWAAAVKGDKEFRRGILQTTAPVRRDELGEPCLPVEGAIFSSRMVDVDELLISCTTDECDRDPGDSTRWWTSVRSLQTQRSDAQSLSTSQHMSNSVTRTTSTLSNVKLHTSQVQILYSYKCSNSIL